MIRSDLVASEVEGAAATLELEREFVAHAAGICRFLGRLGLSRAEAEDVMAEAFLIAHRKRDQFDPSRPARPWLMGIAAQLAKRHRRKLWVRSLLSLRLEQTQAPEPVINPERAMMSTEDAARVQKALARMPDKKRTLLVMFELEEMSALEIGAALGMPEATVYSALHYARKELLKQYRRLGVTEDRR